MIVGVGTDVVAVGRLLRWTTFTDQRLRHVFTSAELDDSRLAGQLAPQKLAVRFAAKEAFYKALSVALVHFGATARTGTFMAVCKGLEVRYGVWQVPVLSVDWDYLQELFNCTLPPMQVHLSVAHEKEMAVAFVTLSEVS